MGFSFLKIPPQRHSFSKNQGWDFEKTGSLHHFARLGHFKPFQKAEKLYFCKKRKHQTFACDHEVHDAPLVEFL
jgi:hypothetical protein